MFARARERLTLAGLTCARRNMNLHPVPECPPAPASTAEPSSLPPAAAASMRLVSKASGGGWQPPPASVPKASAATLRRKLVRQRQWDHNPEAAIARKTKASKSASKSSPLPAESDIIEIAIYKYSDTARLHLPGMPDAALYQVGMRESGKVNTLGQIENNLDACLRRAALEPHAGPLPATWAALQKNWHVRICYAPSTDPARLAFDRRVITFYVAGDVYHLERFLIFLNTFFTDCLARPSRSATYSEPRILHIHPHVTVPLTPNLADSMTLSTHVHLRSRTPPIASQICAPPQGNLHVLVRVEFTTTKMYTTITGMTHPFHDQFGLSGLVRMPCGPVMDIVGRTAFHAYLCPPVQLGNLDHEHELMRVLTIVMHHQLLLATIEIPPEPNTPGAECLAELSGLPTLLFRTMQEAP